MALLGRLAYTHYTRRKGPELSYASTAETNTNCLVGFNTEQMALHHAISAEDTEHESSSDNKELHVVENELLSETASDQTFSSSSLPHASIAIFPQYVATGHTTLIIREWSVPHFSESFSVHVAAAGGQSAPIFNIEREIPSFRHRQRVTEASTGKLLMSITRNVGSLPRSYWFEDPKGAKILDLQGDFFVPFTGAKSRALFKNAAAPKGVDASTRQDRANVELWLVFPLVQSCDSEE